MDEGDAKVNSAAAGIEAMTAKPLVTKRAFSVSSEDELAAHFTGQSALPDIQSQ